MKFNTKQIKKISDVFGGISTDVISYILNIDGGGDFRREGLRAGPLIHGAGT